MFQNDGITDNPNETIVNLTNYSLSSDELEVLKLRLRYGLATRPNQLEIMAVAEDVWRQISRLHGYAHSLSDSFDACRDQYQQYS